MGLQYSHLSRCERTLIKNWRHLGISVREIGRRLNRSHTTISREIRRNLWFGRHYYVRSAQEFYEARLKRRAQRFRLKSPAIRCFVHEKMALGWTPEIISGRLKTTTPEHYICHESIYQYVYLQERSLIDLLPRKHTHRRKKFPYRSSPVRIKNRVSIAHRPEAASSRLIPGHWESDTIVSGDRQSGLNVAVERTSRLTNISRLSRKTAEQTANVLVRRLTNHPVDLVKSITYDNGAENVLHEKVNNALQCTSYFCEPYHSWEKGSVEQINGLIRRKFPKGTNFDEITNSEINRLEKLLNNRPRKCLNYQTPYEVFQQSCGALTG